MGETLKIANAYGNVDVRQGLPRNYAHIPGPRLQPLCRKLGVKFAPAFVGWGGSGGWWRPVLDGVVVSAKAADRLRQAVAEREKRTEPARRERKRAAEAAARANERARRWRQAERWVRGLEIRVSQPFPGTLLDDARACFPSGGPSGDLTERQLCAYVRHELTNFDTLRQAVRQHEFRRGLYPLLRGRADAVVMAALAAWRHRDGRRASGSTGSPGARCPGPGGAGRVQGNGPDQPPKPLLSGYSPVADGPAPQ